jgi:hypothetical protein
MNLSLLQQSWTKFFFEQSTCYALSIYRICFGVLILQMSLIHLDGHFSDWYGPNAIVNITTVKEHFWLNEPRLDLLACLPATEESTKLFYYIFVLSGFALTIGLFSQSAAFITWLILVSLHHQDPYNINGGDAFLRLNCLFLALSSCGARYSVDALIRRQKNQNQTEILAMPWAQRMIQIQIAVVYWHTFCCKIVGSQWLDGTAVYYASRLDDMFRFPLPLITDSMPLLVILNWFTLIIELFGFTLIWFKETRYYVLAGLALLHLGIDYTINLPVFEWAFIATLLLFVPENDLKKFLKQKTLPIFRKPNQPSKDNVAVVQGN